MFSWTAVAIVLAVLMLVVSLILLRKRLQVSPKKPRRRNSRPLHLQLKAVFRAHLKRHSRGLRFPTRQARKDHQKFLMWWFKKYNVVLTRYDAGIMYRIFGGRSQLVGLPQ